MTALREQAAAAAHTVADRLRQPEQVVSSVTAVGNLDQLPDGSSQHPWVPASLASGHAGIALLFAELGRPADLTTAHAHLAAAIASGAPAVGGLYHGLAGLGIAAISAARGREDYAGLLGTVDTYVAREAELLVNAELARIAAGRPAESLSSFDLISGATGLAAYLLQRPGVPDLLPGLLRYLIALTEPAGEPGGSAAGWWVPGEPSTLGRAETPDGPGHLNLGLAHGIPGPLAVMSLALLAGMRTAGLAAAVENIRDWLYAHLLGRDAGRYWPAIVPVVAGPGGATGDRSAWCYGTPGVAYATYLAAQALGEPARVRSALDLLWISADRAEREGVLTDPGLCHGWGGLLAMVCRAIGTGPVTAAARPAWSGLADRLASRILAQFEPDAAFGFRWHNQHTVLAPDRGGFLDGAAGVALALLNYASPGAPRGRWPAALLLSGAG